MTALMSIEIAILPKFFLSVKMASRKWKIERDTRGCCGSILKTEGAKGIMAMWKLCFSDKCVMVL